jgi:YD repeat-containing protein
VGFALGTYDHTLPLVIDPVLVYSTFLGGNGADGGFALAVDVSGAAYVVGITYASDFPTTPGVLSPVLPGTRAAFVSKLVAGTPTVPLATTMHLHYTYDAANRRTGLTYADGQSAGWGYDAAGRVSSLVQPGGGSWTVTHDGAGNLTGMSAPNGGSEQWGYDAAGRLTSTSWLSGSTTLYSQTATLDAAGQRTQLQDSWGTSSYGHTHQPKLWKAGSRRGWRAGSRSSW